MKTGIPDIQSRAAQSGVRVSPIVISSPAQTDFAEDIFNHVSMHCMALGLCHGGNIAIERKELL